MKKYLILFSIYPSTPLRSTRGREAAQMRDLRPAWMRAIPEITILLNQEQRIILNMENNPSS